MSTTSSTTPTPATQAATVHAADVNAVVNLARTLPEQITRLEAVDPALAAQLTGSLATYLKSGASPVAGAVAGWFVGQAVGYFGLACTATVTTACWSPGFVDGVANALAVAGTALGALVMHYISKAPARAVVAATVPPNTASRTVS